MFVAFYFTERCLEEPLLNCIITDWYLSASSILSKDFFVKNFKHETICSILSISYETICSILSISSVARSRVVYPVPGRRAEHVKTPTGRKENPDRILEGREL